VAFNLGEVQNWGHELALDVTAIQTRDWGLDVGANVATNGNLVVKWLGSDDPATSNRIGRPIQNSTWDLYHNPDGMGTSYSSGTRTYSTQSCLVDAEDENGDEILDENGDNVEVWRPGLDPSIHGCHYDSENVYGYPMSRPTIVLGTNATLRMPAGITLSARADYRGGHGYWRTTNVMGSAIGRQARSPLCIPYYVYDDDNLLKADTPAIWVRRCRNGTTSSYRHKGETLRLHSIAATLPMDFAFPDQVQNATLTVVLNNAFAWGHGMSGPWGINQGGSTEQLPANTSIRASLRVTF
jgi:hypothetical protein